MFYGFIFLIFVFFEVVCKDSPTPKGDLIEYHESCGTDESFLSNHGQDIQYFLSQ